MRSMTKPVWISIAACCTLIAVVSNYSYISYAEVGRQKAGALPADLLPVRSVPPGEFVVQRIDAQSSLATAGIRAGDHLRFDDPTFAERIPVAGEQLGVTLVVPGAQRHFSISLPVASHSRLAVTDPLTRAFDNLGRIVMLVTGLLILLRGKHAGSSVLLGLAFIAACGMPPLYWPLSAQQYGFWRFWGWTSLYASNIFLLRFAMHFYCEQVAPLRRMEYALFWLVTLALVVAQLAATSQFGANIASVVAMGAAFIYLLRGWRAGGNAALRSRYGLMLFALPLCFMGALIFAALILVVDSTIFSAVAITSVTVGRILGSILFVYAILRHKVLDLGFAINRTLVYGAVSIVLLAIFGMAEWAMDHFLKLKGREANALIDAALALGVFMTFHRIRDAVERRIESVLFREWHDNEASMRRFVREAGHFGHPDKLVAAFRDELKRFAKGAECAIYLATGRGFVIAAGGSGQDIDEDDPALVAVRTEGAVVAIADTHSTISAALVLPIIRRHGLQGFALLGAKPDEGSYRPDEIDLLGWAVEQIGLDLHALRVESLERAQIEQQQHIASLEGQVSVFRMWKETH